MRGASVAFVGPDGAGKSTVTREVVSRLGGRAVRVYMGVNLEEANVALPTTRLALRVKQRRGGRPDLAGWHASGQPAARRMRDTVRVLNLIAEEWYRALIVAYHRRRGRVVVMDRHFLADYWLHDVSPPDGVTRPWVGRLHGYLLRRWYPRPDRVVILDADPELLHRRKPETPLEHLHRRRAEYVEFGRSIEEVTMVPVDRPLEEVIRRAQEAVEATIEPGGGSTASVAEGDL